MGGFGSGRYPWSSRDTVEDWRYRSFGIKDWVDRGLVRPGHAFDLSTLSGLCAGAERYRLDVTTRKMEQMSR